MRIDIIKEKCVSKLNSDLVYFHYLPEVCLQHQ